MWQAVRQRAPVLICRYTYDGALDMTAISALHSFRQPFVPLIRHYAGIRHYNTDEPKLAVFPPLGLNPPNKGLAAINSHPRDARIQFFEEGHIYEVDGRRGFLSCTTLLSRYQEAFDADAVIEQMFARGLRPPYEGQTAEKIKRGWKNGASLAAHLGNLIHSRIHCYFNKWDFPTDTPPEFLTHFLPFEAEVIEPLGYTPYRTEWCIFDEEHGLAGSVDMLYQVGNDPDTLVIFDWKRSCKLSDKTAFGGRKMSAPLGHLPDSTHWRYAMQLNLYRYILQHKYGKTIVGMYLVGLHPELKQGYRQEKVPVLQDEVEAVLYGRPSTSSLGNCERPNRTADAQAFDTIL
jgi:hypothetical protein